MASSSKGKPKSLSSLQRFNDYVHGLQKEFELNSSHSTGPRSSRFNILLGGLRGEFELMALEIESSHKEKDDFKAKSEILAKELQDVRRNFVCGRCNKGTGNSPRIPPSPRLKPSEFVSRPVAQSRSPSATLSRVANPSLLARRPATQNTTVTRKPRSIITSVQTVSKPTFQRSSDHPRRDALRSPSPASASTVDPESDEEHHDWSITFNDKVLKELDVEIAHMLPHQDWVYCVNFSQDGKYLATACRDGKAYIYTVQTGALTCVLRNLLADDDQIIKVCFSPDGMFLATSGFYSCIDVWEIRTKHVRKGFKGHDGCVHSLDFSPNGRHLVSTSDDNTVRLWNMRDGFAKLLTEDNPMLLDMPHYRSAIFSPNGEYVAASHRDGMVRIWCVRSGQLLRRVKAYMNWVNDIAFMPDGNGLVIGRRDKTLKYWDISSLTTRVRAAHDLHEYASDIEELPKEREESVLAVAVLPDSRWVVFGMDSSIYVWDARNAKTQCTLKTSAHVAVEAVDVSPAGHYFASCGNDGTVTVWRHSYITL